MARRHRRVAEGKHVSSERWLLTYSDMITLLMAFFIMMYSMSVVNLEKFREVAISIRSGFGGVLSGGSRHLFTSPPGKRSVHKSMQTINYEQEQTVVKRAEAQIKSVVIEQGLQDKIQVTEEPRGLSISLATDDLLFPQGSAELTQQATTVLGDITHLLSAVQSDVVVEGHTCDLPIHSSTFASNWELSAARATRVVRFLIDEGFASDRLSAVAFAETRPRELNDSEAHRMRNRRVEIVVLHTAPNSYVQQPEVPAPSAGSGATTPTRVKPEIPKVWGIYDQRGR